MIPELLALAQELENRRYAPARGLPWPRATKCQPVETERNRHGASKVRGTPKAHYMLMSGICAVGLMGSDHPPNLDGTDNLLQETE